MVIIFFVGLLSVIVLIIVYATIANSTAKANAFEPLPTRVDQVIYYVSGKPGDLVNITYSNQTGITEQRQNQAVPWSYAFQPEPGQFLYVSAQLAQREGKVVECKIVVNGRIQEEAKSSGTYTIATCSGSAP